MSAQPIRYLVQRFDGDKLVMETCVAEPMPADILANLRRQYTVVVTPMYAEPESQDKRDAERYRFLRSVAFNDDLYDMVIDGVPDPKTPEEFDACTDAAIAQWARTDADTKLAIGGAL